MRNGKTVYQREMVARDLKKLPVGSKVMLVGKRQTLYGEIIMSGRYKIFAYTEDGTREFKPITDIPGKTWIVEEEKK